MSKAFLQQADEYVSLEYGASMKEGVRITCVRGFPALFAESLKNLCYAKNVKFTRVKHPSMGKDRKTGEDRQSRLFELTSQTSVPTMWYNEERPRSVWTEQLALVERVGSGPKLVPDDMALRSEMFGICALILAEDGLVWNNRIRRDSPLARKYGFSNAASKEAPKKISKILNLLCNKLEAQKARGSKFIVGDALTAADIYLATMSYMFVVPSEEFLPRTKQTKLLDLMFGNNSPEVQKELKPILVEHRDFIIKTFCEFPVNNGGDPL